MKKKEAEEITGRLSYTIKMACPSYNLPASSCKTGSKLRNKEGTVCNKCYGYKGRYIFPGVKNAQLRRLKAINNPLWVEGMIALIKKSGTKYFRFHDCGDVQSIEHLRNIINICRRCPDISFWMPTKETKLIKLARKKGLRIPKNLCIRHSEPFIGHNPNPTLYQLNTSTVDVSAGFQCPVNKGTETCEDYGCRKCWDKKVKNVNYKKH